MAGLVGVLAEAGERDRAEAIAQGNADPSTQARVLAQLAEVVGFREAKAFGPRR